MREIKYRIWDETKKEYVEDYDDFFLNPDGELCIIDSYEGTTKWCKPGRYIVEQYTGLKDKNGKEIYEGDIIRTEDSDYQEIKYIHEEFEKGCLVGFMALSKLPPFAMSISPTDEVIGNIHESPELLEVLHETL